MYYAKHVSLSNTAAKRMKVSLKIYISAYFKLKNPKFSWLLMNLKYRSLSLCDLGLHWMKIGEGKRANYGLALSQLDCP